MNGKSHTRSKSMRPQKSQCDKSMCDLYICVALLSIEIITTCIHEIYLSIIKIKFLFFSFMKYNLWLIVLEIAYIYVCTKKIISSFEKETNTFRKLVPELSIINQMSLIISIRLT